MKTGKEKLEKAINAYWLHECNDEATRIPLVEYRVFIFNYEKGPFLSRPKASRRASCLNLSVCLSAKLGIKNRSIKHQMTVKFLFATIR